MSPEQCRAARSWFGWPQGELARRSGVGLSTIKQFESGQRTPIRNNLNAITKALEDAGVRFVDGEGESGIAVASRADVEA